MFNRLFRTALVASLLWIPGVADAALVASGRVTQESQEKAEKERKKREDKAAEKAAKEARDDAEIMKNVRDELDELGMEMLQSRYEDPFLQDYVNELGQRLVPKEVPSGVLFSFRVLDNPEPNAFALPDGRVYVNSGLLVFVDNEAQLAMILGHEIGHVTERHYIDSVRQAKREALVGGIVGAAAGAVLGGIFGGRKGAAEGGAVGAVAGLVVAKVRMNSYSRKQEDEADRVGTMLSLDRKFDAKESVAFFQKLLDAYGEQDRFANSLWGRHSRNQERMANINALLGGELSGTYNQGRSAGNLSAGTGQLYMFASRMVRDHAIVMMDVFDRYDISKRMLEKIVDYRASDPKTLWAIGRVYKLVGRTDADRAKALDYLQKAAELDSRNVYPFTYRELGLMQARLGEAPAAVESLKKYVLGHITKYDEYPPDLEEMYDYLLAFGDRTWTAPAVEPAFIRAKLAQPAGITPAPAPRGAPAPKPKPTVKSVKPPIPKPGGGN